MYNYDHYAILLFYVTVLSIFQNVKLKDHG